MSSLSLSKENNGLVEMASQDSTQRHSETAGAAAQQQDNAAAAEEEEKKDAGDGGNVDESHGGGQGFDHEERKEKKDSKNNEDPVPPQENNIVTLNKEDDDNNSKQQQQHQQPKQEQASVQKSPAGVNNNTGGVALVVGLEEDYPHTYPIQSLRSSTNTGGMQSSTGMETFASSHVSSSLHLRKLPPEVLLVEDLPVDDTTNTRNGTTVGAARGASADGMMEDDDDSVYGDDDMMDDNDLDNRKSLRRRRRRNSSFCWPPRKDLLHALCLNPRFELRTQLLLSFGSLGILCLLLVVIASIFANIILGDSVKDTYGETVTETNEAMQGHIVRYLAESFDHRVFPRDLAEILYHATLDRFQGYPMDSDAEVPFADVNTGENGYPLTGPFVPMDWNVSMRNNNDVTPDNFQEHIQTRGDWYGDVPLTTASAMYHFQGTCDPLEKDPSSPVFYPGCTDAHNDLTTGGIVAPSNLTAMLHRKGSDLVPYLKAIYEYNQDVREFGIYFANDGSGSVMNFPAFAIDGRHTFVSTGCEWMAAPNPYDPSRPIGTPDQIAKCHLEGEVVNSREYTPMERAWCREQALNPQRIMVTGPYLDAFLPDVWLMTVGRAVYDRSNNNFIACIYIGLDVGFVEDTLRDSRVYNESVISIVRSLGGAVLASSAWEIESQGVPPPITDFDIGINESALEDFRNLVDFTSVWDPVDARAKYQNFFIESKGNVLVSYPFPTIPATYDESYRPEFLTIISVPARAIFREKEAAAESVDERIKQTLWFSVTLGLAAILVLLTILLFVAHTITSPLIYMNETAKQIVANFGDDSAEKEDLLEREAKKRRWNLSPKTEITDVVSEFRKLVSSFSGGSLMAQNAHSKYCEVASFFPLRTVFADLYKSRGESTALIFSTQVFDEALEDTVHLGSNLVEDPDQIEKALANVPTNEAKAPKSGFSSPLFLWIVALIVGPLLVTMFAISFVSTAALTREFYDGLDNIEDFVLNTTVRNLEVSTQARAAFSSVQVSRSMRDLYVMKRYATWLLFDGLAKTDILPAMQNTIEDCKLYANAEDCPAAQQYYVCDCAWGQNSETCRDYENGSRRLQLPYWIVQSDMALPNGTRFGTGYPSVSYSKATTEWWRTDELPNQTSGPVDSGYSTTSHRARAISPALHVLTPLMNYDVQRDHVAAFYFAFEDDGLVAGSEGCKAHLHSAFAGFVSTETNEKINSKLCPAKKYGFDPRCREWYDSCRKTHDKGNSFHVTSPYLFALGGSIGQSAVSALVDPRNGYYVGAALFDFNIDVILYALTDENTPLQKGGFALLITPTQVENEEGDTVIGPGFNQKTSPSKSVATVVIPDDLRCSNGNRQCEENIREFNAIVQNMKDCKTGTETFRRRTESGGTELLYISYAPVRAAFLDPVDPTHFARGANLRSDPNMCVYSLALVETEHGLLEAFREVEYDLRAQAIIVFCSFAGAILIAIVIAIVISFYVAKSITGPMLLLLRAIKSVEHMGPDREPPVLDKRRGSKEIVNVSDTMETLLEVVRFANVAFYAGELEVAYRVLRDSLRIFKGMKNNKAISVACNNLGNVLLFIYREMKHEGAITKYGLTIQDVIAQGTAYFHESITLGEAAYEVFYEAEGWTPKCLDFMQHLSNRYFNRAMFLLNIKEDHRQPADIERLGMRDLRISRDMDVEITDQGEEVGWGRINRAEKLFNVGLTRVRGLLLLLDAGYPDEWEIEEKLEELVKTLLVESHKGESDLFLDIGFVGRLQEVETLMMRYCMLQNEVEKAARVAIRSLFEDEYLFAETKVATCNVLAAYVALNKDKWGSTVTYALKKWLEDSMDSLSLSLKSERQAEVSDQFLSILSKSLRKSDGDSAGCCSVRREPDDRFTIGNQRCVTMENF